MNAVKEDPDWPNIEATKNILDLWLRIADISMNGTDINFNAAKRDIESHNRFNRLRQKADESVGDFYERFNSHYEALVASDCFLCNAPRVVDEWEGEQFDQARQEFQEQEERAKAMSFLQKLDRTRWGSMMDELENSTNLGRDDYPDTLNAAYILARRRRVDGIYVDSQKAQPKEDRHDVAFVAKTKAAGEKKPSSNGSIKCICYFCKKPGHGLQDCPNKPDFSTADPKVKEKLKKVLGLVSLMKNIGSHVLTGSLEHPFKPTDILLDNKASVSVFNNRNLLTNIRKANITVQISGIGNGSIATNLIGDFNSFRGAYYHPEAIANILCFFDINKKYGIQFNGVSFLVKFPEFSHPLEFKTSNKLYICDHNNMLEDCTVEKETVVLANGSSPPVNPSLLNLSESPIGIGKQTDKTLNLKFDEELDLPFSDFYSQKNLRKRMKSFSSCSSFFY